MPRERKRHQQQAMLLPAPGRTRRNRPGAGRPKKPGARHHDARVKFDKLSVLHVTLRLERGHDSLRQRAAYDVLAIASKVVSRRRDFGIVHISIEVDHVHLIVEADNNEALTNGIRAFEVSASQRLNRLASKQRGERVRGRVFADRYHVRFVTSPTQARNAINYVLNNWRRHDQDEASLDVRFWDVDYMSSAISFDGWIEHEQPDFAFRYRVPDEARLCVTAPRSWLLSKGWRKAGSISMYAVPGPDVETKRNARRNVRSVR